MLINIDSRIPNLALHKIALYHQQAGDEVFWDIPLIRVDKVYVSCVFDWNKDKCKQWEEVAEIGGSGYDLVRVLPDKIEDIKPKINLGFTTRGCIRKCPFCIVPRKEGYIRATGDIYDIWDGKSKEVVLLDNNILALPEHFKKICSQIRESKIKVDFNQGLDHRLLTQDIIDELKTLSHIEYRFAFDSPSYLPTVERAIKLLRENSINRCMWYVLVGYNTTFEEDLFRLNFLREHKQNAYVQRYKFERQYIPLARWANQPFMFHALTYNGFLEKCKKEIGGKYITEFTL